MAVLTATYAKGLLVAQGVTPLYTTHDNASDNFVAGVYSHNPLEASATEFDLMVSSLLYVLQSAGQFVQDITAGQTVDVAAGNSLVVAKKIQVDGTLQVDGDLVIVG